MTDYCAREGCVRRLTMTEQRSGFTFCSPACAWFEDEISAIHVRQIARLAAAHPRDHDRIDEETTFDLFALLVLGNVLTDYLSGELAASYRKEHNEPAR